jgi:hypothetical protein
MRDVVELLKSMDLEVPEDGSSVVGYGCDLLQPRGENAPNEF